MIICTNLLIGLAQQADRSNELSIQSDISIRHSLLHSFLCLLQSLLQVQRNDSKSNENERRSTCWETIKKSQKKKEDKHNSSFNFYCLLSFLGPSQPIFHIL